MSDLFWLTEAQIARLVPCFPNSHGAPRVDDRRNLPEGTAHGVQSGREKRGRGRLIGPTKDGMNAKPHAICDSKGRPIKVCVSAGRVSDCIGARALIFSLTDTDWLHWG